MQKMVIVGIMIIMFGFPGFLWKDPEINDTVYTPEMHTVHLQTATMGSITANQWLHKWRVPSEKHRCGHYGENPTPSEYDHDATQTLCGNMTTVIL